ncbi:MAG: hypothetical protein K8T90_09920 [Planctomycetes bacterium]|nr:hypothetical protein [Planctomycetota bacterium]
MRTFRSLLSVLVFGTTFLLALGIIDLARIDDEGAFEWNPRFDSAGLGRLSRRTWRAVADTAHDAFADDTPAQTARAPHTR